MSSNPSVRNAVSSQPGESLGVSSPSSIGAGWDTPIVVEIYALGIGVSLVGQGSDLTRGEGSFELEAHGKIFVFDPLRAYKANGLVATIEGRITTVLKPVQAVNQKDLTKVGDSNRHISPLLKATILSLPKGYGKTALASQLVKRWGCIGIVDEWFPGDRLVRGGLHLTNLPVELQGGTA